MRHFNILLAALLFLGIASCKREDPMLGDPPTAEDATFTVTPTTANPNIIDFRANNPDVTAIWDFGNGSEGRGTSVTAIYPNAGTYTVTLTVLNSGGSAISTQEIVIANTDPTLLDNPIYNMLTGGTANGGSKTWVIDSVTTAHFGVGPDPIGSAGNYPEFYAAAPLDKAGVGLYDDRYTFSITGFQFDMEVAGDVYVHNSLKDDFPGSFENGGDYTAPYTDQLGERWTLIEGADTTLTVSNNSFMGMYTGFNTYRILSVSDTVLWLQYAHHEGGLLWYLRLIPEGFVSGGGGGGGGGDPGATLPIDFETEQPAFTTFGNSSYAIIANPDPSGINTSATVLETVHGNETWAGLYVELDGTLDFSTTPNISVKVWAPVAGDFRLKVENSANTNEFVEIDGMVTTANAWEEVVIDFSGSTNGLYDRIVLFPGWNVANAGTFYLDDIQQQ